MPSLNTWFSQHLDVFSNPEVPITRKFHLKYYYIKEKVEHKI